MTLGELFTKHGSDKNTTHTYGPVYERLLASRRDAVRDVLEIGVQSGASLLAWRDYFPDAMVLGVDNNLGEYWRTPRHDRITTLEFDAADAAKWDELVGPARFDLIVDDGSHWEKDQIRSWEILWPRLRPGGVYVVEDVQCPESWGKFVALGAEVIDLRPGRGWDNVLAVWTKPGVPDADRNETAAERLVPAERRV